MSRQIGTLFVFVAFAVVLPGVMIADQETLGDPVLEFYRERAAGQVQSRNPDEAGLSYTLTVRAYLTKLGRGGKQEMVDSARFDRHIAFGEMDSQQVMVSTSKRLTEVDLGYPNIFAADYYFRFYPNDTGGPSLAIGFESDTVSNLSPVGLAVIDRTRYFLRRLYLYYPDVKKYERYSRALVFRERHGFVFPDTVVTTFAESGIFSIDYYRMDVYVDSVAIEGPAGAAP